MRRKRICKLCCEQQSRLGSSYHIFVGFRDGNGNAADQRSASYVHYMGILKQVTTGFNTCQRSSLPKWGLNLLNVFFHFGGNETTRALIAAYVDDIIAAAGPQHEVDEF